MATEREQARGQHGRHAAGEERGAAGAGTLGDHLRRIAASEAALYLKTKAAHWTVTGPLFRELHEMLDDHAKIAVEAVDEVAERAAQIGTVPPLTLAEIGKLSAVPDRAAGELSNREMLEALAVDEGTVIEALRAAVQAAEQAKDPATVDLLSDIVRAHEKAAWFLRRTLERPEGGL